MPGQKLEPFVWKTVGGWAEGFFLSAMRRAGQALELRLLLEQMFDAEAHRLIAVAGDFNAEDHEVPLKIIVGAEEDTGNGALSSRSLVLLDRALPDDRRWSVLHHGRPQMLDHILASRTLQARFAEHRRSQRDPERRACRLCQADALLRLLPRGRRCRVHAAESFTG